MTLEKFRRITAALPEDTTILIDLSDDEREDVGTVSIEYHTDGRAHLVLSDKE